MNKEPPTYSTQNFGNSQFDEAMSASSSSEIAGDHENISLKDIKLNQDYNDIKNDSTRKSYNIL